MTEQLALAIKALSISTKQLLTKEECAAMLGITVSALEKRVSRREIPFYKNGGHTYFKRDDIEAEVLSPRNRMETVTEASAQLARTVTRMTERKRRHPSFGGIAHA